MDSPEPHDTDHRHASRRLADELRSHIDAGTYPAGSRLPSYRALAAEYGLAVNTVREAVRLLQQEGRLSVRQGSGAYVHETASPVPAETQLRELRAELAALRKRLTESGDEVRRVERRISAVLDRLPSSDHEVKSRSRQGR